MNKTLKNIINKTFDREYDIAMEDFGSSLKKNSELEREYKQAARDVDELRERLLKLIPDDFKELLEKFELDNNIIASIESRVAFKEGVILGIRELNYLGEVGQEIAII
jgi:hypothetical protein